MSTTSEVSGGRETYTAAFGCKNCMGRPTFDVPFGTPVKTFISSGALSYKDCPICGVRGFLLYPDVARHVFGDAS